MLISPEAASPLLVSAAKECESCEADRRPRMFICAYHEGWWDGYEEDGGSDE